ncbi:beta-hexosamidase a, glycoside hydrolase family 3 [Lactobacillus selangorensis]|uniref:beta-N-acetylhexosaminidase n=1 Tax=Lactobacillus selangorensis TaxID=81857 RepID=A0A0R2FG92_9LACO|nr:glycoside hydrolase family 3 N-terminal domain-containing protein [Lactobacillus selangorensis]KRN27576.1 beta-hexosamidase a, glycoside hydrolase family 3 [Lactobacillus selangorensis]KRN30151.1 beta-hexosamidase a, glycoside hydrolase family 3 [Lactobacillus selangorensis]
MLNMHQKPFYLNDDQIKWVKDTAEKLSTDEKIGQLFVPIGYSTDHDYIDSLLKHHIGGLFFRSAHLEELRATFNYAQQNSKVPLLTPANLESGGDGAVLEGTGYAPQMAVAAAGNKKYAYELGKIAAEDAKAAGINWGFAPVVDLDLNFHSPIMNVRTYGDDTERDIAFSKQFIQAFHDQNMMTSIKHFPGDGIDERDQHLLTSVNSLPLSSWWKTYGKIYRELIDFGTKAVMVGHIAFPAYSHNQIPASLNEQLLEGLLRHDLGFNGLIITDATPMVGFSTAMPRYQAVPTAIQNGCDMFLFNHDFEEDVSYMKDGLKNGLLTEKRLDEAVLRILATKASLNLNQDVSIPSKPLIDYKKEQQEIADQSITLVKDDQNILPLAAQKQKRVLLEVLGGFASNQRVEETLQNELTKRGFEVTLYRPEKNFVDLGSVADFKSKYDLVLYAANIENASNQTTARINWKTLYGLGNNLPWFVQEVPTVLVSFGNPYHMFDMPMVKTVVNAYSNYEHFIKAAVAKLVGEQEFKGHSPIDPNCKNIKLKELMNNAD